jgi:hypothetical protein
MKRHKWLAGEDKRNPEPTQRSRSTMEIHQPQIWDISAEIGIHMSMLEQLLKEIM